MHRTSSWGDRNAGQTNGARRNDGKARTDVGGGKIEPPHLFVWLGRAAIVPPSHAGAYSTPQIAECIGLFRAVGRRDGFRGDLSHVPPLPQQIRETLLILHAQLLQ